MKGKLLRQINNLKITLYLNTYFVYTPKGNVIFFSKDAQEVRIFCENCFDFKK